MLRHLKECEGRKEAWTKEPRRPTEGYFLLEIAGEYEEDYWLIVEVSENARLSDLDQFLRDIWLECCGHLSEFKIGRVYYENDTEDVDFLPPNCTASSMDVKLRDVFRTKKKAEYNYDFGTTTELEIKVKDYRRGGRPGKRVPVILSRNKPPVFMCDICGKNEAKFVRANFRHYGTVRYLCWKCTYKAKAEDVEMLLPVCNSPRMGECAYEGSDKYPDNFSPIIQ